MKDKIDRSVIGAVGGLAGGLTMIIALQLSRLIVPGAHPKLMHVAHLFVPPRHDHTFWGNVLAHIAHFSVSAMLGVLFIYIFRLTGRDWVTSKGLIFGGFTWIVVFGIAGKLLKIPTAASIGVAFVMLAGHLFFGLATAWSTYWLSERAKL